MDRQITIRASAADVDRLDRLAELLTSRMPGVDVNRSAAARAALLRGIDAIESELAAKKTKR